MGASVTDPYSDYFGQPEPVYQLVAVKRQWVPEWLWALAGLGLPPRYRPVIWCGPLRRLLTTKNRLVTDDDPPPDPDPNGDGPHDDRPGKDADKPHLN